MNRDRARFLTAALMLAAVATVFSGCHSQQELVIQTTQDAAKARIGVMTGSTGEQLAKVKFPQANVQTFDDVMNAVAALEAKKLDAVLTTFPTAQQVAKKNQRLRVIDEPLDQEDTSVAIRKGDTAMVNDVNHILAELKADGTLDSMRKRWLKPDLSPYEIPAIEVPTRGKPLVVGVSATREPLSFVDAEGKVTGHDGELARRIAAALKRPLQYQDMKFLALIPALKSGKVDLVITGMTATEERKKSVDFSVPYFFNSQVLLVVKPNAGAAAPSGQPAASNASAQVKLATPDDLKDKQIGTLLGTAHSIYVIQHYPNATLREFMSTADLMLAVKAHKVDAALYDSESLRSAMRDDASIGAMKDNLFTFDVGVGFNRKQTALRTEFNAFLATIKKNGVYADMLKRWMEQGDSTMPQLAMPASGTPINVAVSDVGLPFVAVKDNKLAGFDIELITRFAESIGRPLKFSNMDFGSLIAAVSSGKSELFISSVYITEERKKQVDFSDPYFAMGTQIFALKENLAASAMAPPVAATTAPAQSAPSPLGKMSTLDDLRDKRLGVLLGSVHDAYATKNFPQATVMQYKSPSDLILAVRTGKVDASFYIKESLDEVLRQDPELATFGGNNFMCPIGTGYRKGNTQLREQFNTFLATIKKNGVYDDMVKRWIKDHNTTMPKIDNPGTKGKVVVGFVSDKGMPFTVVRDNQPIGFDMELIQRFGAYLNKKIDLNDMEFGSLIAAVSTGKIDMIVSTLMITEERKQRIDFSDPYYDMETTAFALKSNLAAYSSQGPAKESHSFLSGIADSFNSNIVMEKRYLLILDGLKTTIVISIFAAVFGTLLGALVCFMRMSKLALVNIPAKIYIGILRGTPVLVLLMVIFYVVFASVSISPVLVAVVAFGMNFAAYAAEIFRSGIEGIDRGQTEAGIAMGFTPMQTFLHIVLPQTVQRILPVYKGEFISLVKMTSIVGYIAVQDLTKASDIIRSRTFDAFFPLIIVAILYFLIAWALTQGLERLEKMSNSRNKRKGA